MAGRSATSATDGGARLLSLSLLCHLQGVVNLNAKVPHGTLEFGMTQEQLNSPEILCSPVNQRGLSLAKRVSAVISRVQPQLKNPGVHYPRILAGRQMRRDVDAAREQKILRFEPLVTVYSMPKSRHA